MNKIINLTQHQATEEQKEAGVFEYENMDFLRLILTFDEIPSKEYIASRAKMLCEIALMYKATHAMIGGAPFLMSALEAELKKNGIQPLYAFSKRVVKEVIGDDGKVIKTSVFKHEGFIEV